MVSDRVQSVLYLAALWLAGLAAIFWCFLNFLTAEDSVVLFNRFNFLTDAPVFFYYAGYTSTFPQVTAFLLSFLNPVAQAILYSLVALGVFLLLLREVFVATRSGLLVILLTAICAVFHPFVIYNLTFSFWPGLAILGLVGLRAHVSRRALRARDILICLPGLAGSPLAIAFLPSFAWAAFRTRSPYAVLLSLATLASFVALTEHGGTRAEGGGLLSSFVANAGLALQAPLQYLVNAGSPGDLAISVLGAVSLPVTIVAGVWALFSRKAAGVPVALYALGAVLVVFAAFAATSVPLAGRYWFPAVVSAIVLVGLMAPLPARSQAGKVVASALAGLLCVAVLASFWARAERWGAAATGLQEWRLLADAGQAPTAIIRHWHGDSGLWAVGAGRGALPYADCAGLTEHPESVAQFGFRIHCGRAVFR